MMADAVQRALLDALRHGDSSGYFAVIAESPLLLPLSAGTAGVRPVAAALEGGRCAVTAFTSIEGLHRSVAGGAASPLCPVSIAELADRWPDPAWVLSIDPGLPTAAYLTGDNLREMVEDVFAPENDVEVAMVEARRSGERHELILNLVRAELHLPLRAPAGGSRDLTDPEFPWWAEPLWTDAPGVRGIGVPVFTSERRLRARLGLEHPAVDFVIVDLYPLVSAWPDPSWTMAVNPGTPMAVTLTGDDVHALTASLDQVKTDPLRFLDPGQDWWSQSAADTFELQVAIAPASVGHYLDGGYDRVAGIVHPRPARRRLAPAALYLRLGLVRPQSPFALGDEAVHLVRWHPSGALAQEWRSDPAPRLASVTLPDGAVLVRLARDGSEELVARFDGHRWASVTADR
jgi:hypothetical protein